MVQRNWITSVFKVGAKTMRKRTITFKLQETFAFKLQKTLAFRLQETFTFKLHETFAFKLLVLYMQKQPAT